MSAMKLFALIVVPYTASAATWSTFVSRSAQLGGNSAAVRKEDVEGCQKEASKYIEKPMVKSLAIEHAMDHCALDKKVDDRNFVCPHFKEVLTNAFARESTFKEFTVDSFCDVAETYVYALKYGAANIANVAGKGKGKDFEVSKDCEPIVVDTFKPETSLPSTSVPDFWYALCMNQDCAHFLPSRTRWCTQNRAPVHSAAVCEAIRTYARDEVVVVGEKNLDAKEVCDIYDEFVEDSYINVEAYMHVMHHQKKHPVPSPDDPERALASARMKNDAGAHQIRDSAGDPVKSAASVSMLLSVTSMATVLLQCLV
jgi:hypothetical protein